MRFKPRKFALFLGIFLVLNGLFLLISWKTEDDPNDIDMGVNLKALFSTTTPKPQTTTPYYDGYEMDNRTKVHFNSLQEAALYMKETSIKRSPRIIIHYPKFKRKLPKFISEDDEQLFLISDRNKEYLEPITNQTLRGVIEVIPNATFKMDYTCGYKSNYDFVRETRKASRSFDILVPLVIPMGFLFQHFFDGTVPKIMQAYEFIKRDDVRILLERPKHRNVYDLLDILDIPPEKIVWHMRDDTSTVYCANYMLMICVAPPLHPVLWAGLRKRLRVSDDLKIPLNQSKVMLLTRAGASIGGRNIINQQEVKDFLSRRYNSSLIVFDGSYDVYTAVEVFSQVGLIIGPHGGAFYNLVYSSRQTTVVEFGPVLRYGQDITGLPHAIFWALADMLGLQYWRIECISQNYQHDMKVDVDKLSKILDVVDKERK